MPQRPLIFFCFFTFYPYCISEQVTRAQLSLSQAVVTLRMERKRGSAKMTFIFLSFFLSLFNSLSLPYITTSCKSTTKALGTAHNCCTSNSFDNNDRKDKVIRHTTFLLIFVIFLSLLHFTTNCLLLLYLKQL